MFPVFAFVKLIKITYLLTYWTIV